MRNPKHPDREKVRIDFSKSALNAASNIAATKGETLSVYIERLVRDDLGKVTG